MVQSMTGFGAAERGVFRVEARSLNHRYMDVSVRMPGQLVRHEMQVRELLRERFQRGKIDVYVTLTGRGEVRTRMDVPAARDLYVSLCKLRDELGIADGVGMDELLRWKEHFMDEEVSFDAQELLEAAREAFHGLEQMRLREGASLTAEIDGIVASIEEANAAIEAICPAVMSECRKRFEERFRTLFKDCVADDPRLWQEAAQLVEKSDISEEVARVKSHIAQMRGMLGQGGSIGRKLDFLLQELNREANTMASKTTDPALLGHVIEMKSNIERAREQAQNIQ